MSIVWHDEGENRVLNILLGSTAPDTTLYLGLLKNLSAPAEDAILTGLTEPSGYGYARKALLRTQWTIAANSATYAQQTFLAAGGDWDYITGYFLATSPDNSGKLLASEYFDTPLLVVDGKGIKIVPKITVT
jgi:hypothetical protein